MTNAEIVKAHHLTIRSNMTSTQAAKGDMGRQQVGLISNGLTYLITFQVWIVQYHGHVVVIPPYIIYDWVISCCFLQFSKRETYCTEINHICI